MNNEPEDIEELLNLLITESKQELEINTKEFIQRIDAEIKNAYSSADKVNLWADFSETLNNIGFAKDANRYIEMAVEEARKIEKPKDQADAYLSIYHKAKTIGNQSLANNALDLAVQQADRIETLEDRVDTYDSVYDIFKEEKKHDKSKEMLKKAVSAIESHHDFKEQVDQFYSLGMDLASNEEFGTLVTFAQSFADIIEMNIETANEIRDHIRHLGIIAKEMCDKSPIGSRYARELMETGRKIVDQTPEQWICISDRLFERRTLWKDGYALELADNFADIGEIKQALDVFESIPVKKWYKFASPRNKYSENAGYREINFTCLLRAFIDAGSVDAALSRVKSVSQKNLAADVYEGAGEYYAEKGETKKAEELFDQAAKLDPSSKDTLLQSYIYAMVKSDPKKALEKFNQMESAFVQSIVADNLCEGLAEKKMYDEAIKTVERITDLGIMEEKNILSRQEKKNSVYADIACKAIENSDFSIAEKLVHEKITDFKERPATCVVQSLAMHYAKENKPELAKEITQRLEGEELNKAKIDLACHYIREDDLARAEDYIKGIPKNKLGNIFNEFLEKGMLAKAGEYMEEITDKNQYIRTLITFLGHAKHEQ